VSSPSIGFPGPVGPSVMTKRRGVGGVDVHMAGVVHLYRHAGGDIVALRSVDLDVDAGEMLALLGPSGMGKTTVLRLMAGVMAPSAGAVRVGARDIGQLSKIDRRTLLGTDISYLVQGVSTNLLPYASAVENVWYAQHGSRSRQHVPPWAPEQVLNMLGLGALGRTAVVDLPLGVQQKVAIAACVSPGPQLLLADEPTARLSPESATEVVDLMCKVNTELGTTVVIVTHDPTVASQFPRTVTIRDGRVGSEGRRGAEYAVIDSSGSLQLPPDVLRVLPPNTRVKVVRTPEGVELQKPEDGR
jgi:putative ABC transport system ATP-binding protein